MTFISAQNLQHATHMICCTFLDRLTLKQQLSMSPWRLKRLSKPLFAIAWAVATIIATAGWAYLAFRLAWHFIGALFR